MPDAAPLEDHCLIVDGKPDAKAEEAGRRLVYFIEKQGGSESGS